MATFLPFYLKQQLDRVLEIVFNTAVKHDIGKNLSLELRTFKQLAEQAKAQEDAELAQQVINSRYRLLEMISASPLKDGVRGRDFVLRGR